MKTFRTRKRPSFIHDPRPALLPGSLITLTCLLMTAHASTAAPPAPTTRVDLRGFGELRVDRHGDTRVSDGGSWITFSAQDAQHATLCASKFLADFTSLGPVRTIDDSKLPATVVTLDGVGWWVLGIENQHFHVLFAPTLAELSARCEKVRAVQWRAVPPHAYPAWLDCFDNASVGFWVLGGGVLPEDLEADMRWFGENHFTMCATGATETRLVAPGVLDTTILDWYAAKAKEYQVPYRMLLSWGSPARPDWVRNIVPLPHLPPADGPEVNAPNFDYQALSSEIAWEPIPATDPWLFDARRRIAEYAGKDPWFAGHHVSAELGGCSILTLERVAGLPATRTAWHDYLREDLHLDLKAVSLRHTGRPDAYANWDAVPVPLPKDFAGWDPATSIDLRGSWQGHPDHDRKGEQDRWFDPAHAPDAWTAVDCNDAMLLMYSNMWAENSSTYWLRRSFNIPTESAAAPLYLHISRNWWHIPHTLMKVWVNGQPLKDLTDYAPVSPDANLCFALGDGVIAGVNQIVLNTMGGAVPSTIFISPVGRQQFPDMSEPLNQRYFDAMNFDAHLHATFLESAMAATRRGDANRPMKVMAPGSYHDALVDLYAQYGAYPHDTGQTGACWAPWTTSMVQARGGQHSSEPGGPANSVDDLRQMATFYFMLGNDAVDMVFHNDHYRKDADLSAWIAGHRQLLTCIGKTERIRAQVAVLRSNRTVRLGIQSPYNWDITRGELQACGRTGQLVDLPDVGSRVADSYPVLFDDSTEVLTDADVDALEAYVRRGGTFIAIHQTGMHSPGRAHAWPIERLTGLRVKQDAPIGGKQIRFSETQTLFPSLRGRSIDGWGLMLDWTSADRTGKSISLEATDSHVETIATWQDNLGVAVGRRRLGKGQIITLGSTFWRDARDLDRGFRTDPRTRPYLDQLLSSLGVPRQSTTVSPDVWAESWRSKNGLFDLYPVACMRTQPEEGGTGDVSVQRQSAPATVWEVSQAGSPSIATRYADGRLILPSVAVEPMLPRLFAAPRADVSMAALHWLDVQQLQWPALPRGKQVPDPPSAPADALVLPMGDGWHMTTGAPPDGWTDRPDLSAPWPTVHLGSFAALGQPEDSKACFFRSTAVPAAWKGQRIYLTFDASNWFWGLNPAARIWVGGQPLAVPEYDPSNPANPLLRSQRAPSFSLDVTDRVRGGRLDLAIEIDGHLDARARRSRPAGVTGIFYLHPESAPLAEKPVTELFAATDINVLTPVTVGQPARFTYLEARFTIPVDAPSGRLFLRSPNASLNVLVINNFVVLVPGSMDRLDISKLVRREGVNTVRWLPGGSTGDRGGWPIFPRADVLLNRAVPSLHLAWWK